MKTDYHADFIKTLEEDFGLMLLTTETADTETCEVMGGSHADGITYDTYPITEAYTEVTGFVLEHPHGGTIRAQFAKPVEVCSASYDEDGVELEFNDHSGTLARAILAKLGNIAMNPDSELGAYAQRGLPCSALFTNISSDLAALGI
jgi:hypothetical protein